MPTYVKGQPFKPQFADSNGNLLSSGTAEFYIWDTATPTAVYTDSAGSGSATTVTFNTRGEPTNDIFYDTAVTYKIVLKDATGATIDTLGPYIPAVGESFVTALTDIRYGRVFATVAAAKADTTLLNGQAVFILGYSAANDGGGGAYQYSSASAATANDATVIALDTLSGRLLHTFITEVNSDTWGIVRTNLSADQATKVQAYRDWCETNGIETLINSGTIRIDSTISIDLGKASFTCRGTTFDISSLSATPDYGLQFFSSLAYPAALNNAYKAAGFIVNGPRTTNYHGVLIGHATNDQCGNIALDDWGVTGCDIQVDYTDNAWRVSHGRCRLNNPLTKYLNYPGSTLTNSGEVMKFDFLMIADGEGTAYIDGHQWRFNGLSLLNAKMVCLGDCHVTADEANFENPANTGSGYLMLDVQGNDTMVAIKSGQLTMSGARFDRPPFNCDSTHGGLHLNNMKVPSASDTYFRPENGTDGLRMLVSGTGNVTAHNVRTFANIAGNSDIVIAKGCNVIYNGDAETNNTNGWTQTDYGSGSAATFTATAGSKKAGTYGFHLDCVDATRGTEITQDVPCQPGRYVCAVIPITWIAGTVALALKCRDTDGNVIGSASTSVTSGAGWQLIDLGLIAPTGTVDLRVELNGNTGASPAECYFDDIIVNIV